MKLKKLLCMLLTLSLLLSYVSCFVYGLSDTSDDVSYFVWTQLLPDNNTKMSSDGTFDFQFKNRLYSQSFKAKSNTLTLNVHTTSYTNAYYIAKLSDITDPSSEETIGRLYAQDKNKSYSKTFTVETNHRYRLTFSKLNYWNPDLVIGSGSVSKVTV